MPVFVLDHLDDPRLAHYRNLKDRELALLGERFLAEGWLVVQRLLASQGHTESILMTDKRWRELQPHIPESVTVYVVSEPQMRQIVGFQFHSGVLGIGIRPAAGTLDQLMARIANPATSVRVPATLVVCPQIINHDNLGSLIRITAGFGAQAMLLGEQCCDPYWRRTIRVSMGTVFSLPVYRSANLHHDLQQLRSVHGYELLATVVDPHAQPLADATRTDKLALLIGSESQGLEPHWISLCDRKVTIPMHWGTDSLNVSIATAVFLYHFTQAARE